MIINLRAVFCSILVLSAYVCYAQAPNISYTSPQTFTTGTAIPVAKPTNTGGAVPAIAYGQVSTFAGTAGAAGLVKPIRLTTIGPRSSRACTGLGSG